MTDSTENICPKCAAPIPVDAPQGLCPKCVLLGVEVEPAKISFTPSGRLNKDAIAPHFPELEILEELGAGGMGTVFKARQPNLDRCVALKVLSSDLAADPSFTERFNREARVLARLNHPHIVAVYDSGMRDKYAFFMMEYVDGVNLRQAMKSGGFDSAESLSLVQDVCSALKFAHENGILHRDIKPENILIDTRGHVKIADFGIAKLLGEDDPDNATLTMDGAVLGTPKYMAPEQIETPGDVDQRADIYSLGVVLYELLTGELPLGRFALPSEKSAIDARIDDIVLRTLQKERELRYQTADEVKTHVQEVASTEPAPPISASKAVKAVASIAAFPTWPVVTTILSLLLGFVGFGIFYMVFFTLVPVTEMSEPTPEPPVAFWQVAVTMILIPVIVASLAVPALVAGWKRLALISRSAGAREGFGRALFCALAWPVLFIFVLSGLSVYAAIAANPTGMSFNTGVVILMFLVTGMLAAYVLVAGTGGWVRGTAAGRLIVPKLIAVFLAPAILTYSWGFLHDAGAVTDSVAKNTTTAEPAPGAPRADGKPLRSFTLVIPPGRVTTLQLVHADPTGQDKVDYEGYILSADDQPWSGSFELYRTESGGDPSRPNLVAKFNADTGDSATVKSQFAYVTGDWEINRQGHPAIDLGAADQYDLELARPRQKTAGTPTRILRLQIESKPRSVEGIPAAIFKLHIQQKHHMARGGAIEWTRQVMQDLEAQMPTDFPKPPRPPEPKWRHGEAEVNFPVSLAPGLVTEMELIVPSLDGSDRKISPSGYLVASDLETMIGTVKLGSFGAADGMMHWRIDGEYNSATIEANLGNLKMDELVTNKVNLTIPGVTEVRIGKLPAADLFLRFHTKKRKAAPGIPRVLATHYFGLGGSTDWAESIRMAHEMMNRSPAPQP